MDFVKTYTYEVSLAIIPLSIYFFMLLKYTPMNLLYMHNSNVSYRIILLCMVLYTTFGFAEPDTYHYHDIYDFMLKNNRKVHVEDVYFWLLTVLPHNYYLWRFIIWGTASYIFVFLAKHSSLHPYALGSLLPVLFLHQLVVTRGALGISLLLLSFYIFFREYSKYKSIFALSFGILLSLAFHNSILTFAFIALLALFIPFNQNVYRLSILLFPFLYLFIHQLVQSILSYGFLSSDSVNFASDYINSAMLTKNINGYIADFFLLSPIIIIVFYELPRFIFNFREYIPSFLFFLFKYSYILFYLGFLFYNQPTSMWISVRTMHAGYFPLVLFLAYFYQESYSRKLQVFYYYLVACSIIIYFLRLKSWL